MFRRALRVIRDVTPSRHFVAGGRARDVVTFRAPLPRRRRPFGRIAAECRGCHQECE